MLSQHYDTANAHAHIVTDTVCFHVPPLCLQLLLLQDRTQYVYQTQKPAACPGCTRVPATARAHRCHTLDLPKWAQNKTSRSQNTRFGDRRRGTAIRGGSCCYVTVGCVGGDVAGRWLLLRGAPNKEQLVVLHPRQLLILVRRVEHRLALLCELGHELGPAARGA